MRDDVFIMYSLIYEAMFQVLFLKNILKSLCLIFWHPNVFLYIFCFSYILYSENSPQYTRISQCFISHSDRKTEFTSNQVQPKLYYHNSNVITVNLITYLDEDETQYTMQLREHG